MVRSCRHDALEHVCELGCIDVAHTTGMEVLDMHTVFVMFVVCLS